jgi:transposase
MEAGGILPKFRGVAHHDALAGYFAFSECDHSLCCAHLLREGMALAARFEDCGVWIDSILDWMLGAKRGRESGWIGERDEQIRGFRGVLVSGYRALGLSPPEAGKGLSDCPGELSSRIRWLDRMWLRAESVTRFCWDARAEFDNNGSERDIRPVKLFSKVFGCWRSEAGLGDFCRIRGYLSTLGKQGISAWAAMISVFRGAPILPNLT